MKSFVSRRLMLQGIAVAVGYGVSSSSQSAFGADGSPRWTVAASTAAKPTMHVVEAIEATPFDAEWTVLRSIRFPRVVDMEGVSDSFECIVRWDERLFSVASQVLVETNQITEIPAEKISTGRLRLSIPAATTRLYFDAQPQPLYPNDNIEDVVLTCIEAPGAEAGEQSFLLPPEAEESPAEPWGIELSGEWTTTEGLITPASLMILSVGPNPVPAGLRVEISGPSVFDPANLAAPEGVYWISDHVDNRTVIYAQLTAPVPSGMSITLGFDQDVATTEPKKNLPVVSGARVVAPERDVQSIRATGKMTAFPLTESGIPVSTFKPRNDPA